MNNSMIRVLALSGLIATIGPASVMAQVRIPFNVPFGFTLGAKTFAAGDYQVVKLSQDVMLVQSSDGHASMIALCRPGEPGKTGKPTLIFHHYGNRYFLSDFQYYHSGLAVPMSAGEKELIAGRASPKARDVVALAAK